MKQLIFSLVFLLPALLKAQEEVVFDRARVHGGFGGPIVEFTSINDQGGVMGGGGGGVILNNFFFGGFGQAGNFANQIVNNREYPINFGYGGLWIGYVVPTLKAIHFFGSVKIGGGSVAITEERDNDSAELFDETVFVVQPEAGAEVNLFKWFRVALTGNFRAVGGIQSKNLGGLSNRDFNSGGISLTLRFGKFYRAKANEGTGR